jgi:copper chaperone
MCEGCIEKITPYLNANNEIRSWSVDIQNSNKVLTVETDNLTNEMIKEIVKKAGYNANEIND